MLSQDQQIQQVQQRVLDIYKVFKALCEKHDLQFFSSGGTSIGAVLYNGFIPWDDDIDINMPREDYDKFIEIAKQNCRVILSFSMRSIALIPTFIFSNYTTTEPCLPQIFY